MLGGNVRRGIVVMAWVVGLFWALWAGASCAADQGVATKDGLQGRAMHRKTATLVAPIEFVVKWAGDLTKKVQIHRMHFSWAGDGEGTLTLDANPCNLGSFGDPWLCAWVYQATFNVSVVPVTIGTTADQRKLYQINTDHIVSPALRLVWGGGPLSAERLLVFSPGNERPVHVITLEFDAYPPLGGGCPCAVDLVPEMMEVLELQRWSACAPDAVPAEVAAAAADWKKKNACVGRQVTPEAARNLSRWAREQMASYQRVPSVAGVKWKPVRMEKTHLLLEAVVDNLPVHAPQVHRWLTLYAVYDRSAKSIDRVTITIRGQRLE